VTARDRLVIMIVVAVGAVAAGWFLVVSPKRQQASKLGGQVAAAQSQLDSTRSQVAQGEQARREFSGRYGELVQLGEAVPADDNVPSLIYQIQNAAQSSHVDFSALQLSGGGSGAPAGASSSSSSSGQAAAPLPPGVAVGPAGFPAEQFSFTFHGKFFDLASFLKRLQQFVVATNKRVTIRGRLITLNAVNLAPAPTGFPRIAATISATTYVLPASQGLVNGATSTGPAGSRATPPATSSGTSTGAAAAIVTPIR
jgi:type II secretory pathway pseudopilin PulG